MKHLTTALAAAAVLTSASPCIAQDSGTFTLKQNGQTIATEEFTRTADRLQIRIAMTNQPTVDADATLNPDATISRVEVNVYAPGAADAEPVQTSAAVFADGEVRVEQPIGTPTDQSATVQDGTIPYLNPSPSYMEQILRRARAIGGDEVAVPIWAPGANAGIPPARVTFDGDQATIMLGSVEVRIQTDAEGRLLSGSVPSQNLTIERS